ncbi:MAG: agmatine deiminase family protein [Verrucomicrobiota bacterium]|nr:agmatine deiminase family protein [Verrucomicrobiota bacterium]
MKTPPSITETPASLGYSMPAEWEPHQATWLSWPRKDGISFPDKFEPVPAYWVKMCELLSQFEEVHINVFDDEHENEVSGHLSAANLPFQKSAVETKKPVRIFLHQFPAYEPWCRDHGPIFVTREGVTGREMAVVDWGYNAWGGKYPPYDLDDAVPQHVAKYLKLPLFSPGIVMEGGSIEVNGAGCLLTTTACLLNKNRNPGLTQVQIEQFLKDYLGVKKILWIDHGIVGDDTDGHIDDITRFVSPTTLVTALEYDSKDENYQPLMENYETLLQMTDAEGRPFRVVTLPMPEAIHHEGQRLPASYANFYMANNLVLVPTFNSQFDGEALLTLREVFPDRKVVGIDSRDLIWGLGAFHCVTQQQPAI